MCCLQQRASRFRLQHAIVHSGPFETDRVASVGPAPITASRTTAISRCATATMLRHEVIVEVLFYLTTQDLVQECE